MSKILGKTVKKATLLSIVLAAIFALATIIGIFFGFNKSVAMEDTKSVTVSMNQFAYSTMLDDVKEDCSTVFKGLDIEYVMEGEMSGDESEIVYVFDKGAKDEKIAVAYTVLKEVFAEKTKTGGVWDGTFINVTYGNEELATAIADEYVARGIIAGVVLLVLAFVYVSIRYKLHVGALTALCTLLGMLLTTSLIVLTRIPVTLSVTYVIFGSALLSAVASLMTYNKIRANKNNEEGLSAEELVTTGIAVNEIVLTTVFFGIALLVVGIVATTAVRWFAVSALVAVLASAIMGLIYAPAFYLPVKKAMDKKPARPGAYQGAKKTSKKTKRVEVKETLAEEVAEVEETPVEETPVEETPVEETVEVEETEVEQE